MIRIRPRLAAVVCAGLLAPIAISTSSGAAIVQDLVVPVTSGAPGTVVTVSSASCDAATSSDGLDVSLRVLFISGSGADAVLAGVGNGGPDASFTVPDWIDPADPAVIEASCITTDYSSDDFTETAEPYDPVAFDALAGVGAPTQTRTFSRTELLTGQSFGVTGGGCASGADAFGAVDLVAGSDLSGRSFQDFVAGGGGPLDGGTFDAQVDLIDWSWGYGWSSSGSDRPTIESIDEGHTEIPAGTYTAVPYCGTYDEATDASTYLMLEPQLIEVTGQAPIDDVDLTVPDGSATGTLAGGSCVSGDVRGGIGGTDIVAEQGEFDHVQIGSDDGFPSPFGAAADGGSRAGQTRAVGHNGWVPFTALPNGDGTWQVQQTADFELGILDAEVTCGDPMADGFAYELQVAAVDVPPSTTTTVPPTTVAPTTPAAPAAAVAGTPTYAG